MALDGKILARARDALAEQKRQNEAELTRRRAEVYKKLPEVRSTELKLRTLMAEVIRSALKNGEDAGRAIGDIAHDSLMLQWTMAALLEKNGYPADYLDEIYSCRDCRDTGYIKDSPCKCLMRLYEQEQARELSSLLTIGGECFESFDLSYYDDAPGEAGGEAPRKWMAWVLRFCKSYAQHFGKNSENLLFQGGTGLGKTYLSACIARVVAKSGRSVVYDTAVGAFEPFEACKFGRTDDYDSASEKVRRILECDLMILDDLGTEMITAFSVSALYTIINTRLMNGKKTIISTNLSDDELQKRYTQQIMSRLDGEYVKLTFAGRDIRRIKRERM